MMMKKIHSFKLAATSCALLALIACGSGSGSGSSSDTQFVNLSVVDGAIKNALVCMDKNLDGVCSADEPSGRTDENGNVSLQINRSDLGNYPFVAMIGTDAVDQDTGPVSIAYSMQTAADRSGVINPFTTLAARLRADYGMSSEAADALLQKQLGLGFSINENYTLGSSLDRQQAARLARTIVLAIQQQTLALREQVGRAATDGSPISAAELDRLIKSWLLDHLPQLLSAAKTEIETDRLSSLQDAITSGELYLSPATIAALIALNRSAANGDGAFAQAPGASTELNFLSSLNPQNWQYQLTTASADDNRPIDGRVRQVARRSQASDGVIANWNTGNSPEQQADLHFNGLSWLNCGLNGKNSSSPPDAQGHSSYNNCDQLEVGLSSQISVDISGKSMRNVYQEIRTAGYTNLTLNSPDSDLAEAVFPAGSRMHYKKNQPLSKAIAYAPGSGNWVSQYSQEVSSGDPQSCDSSDPTFKKESQTLAQMIPFNGGTPCAVSNHPDWSNSTQSLGSVSGESSSEINTGNRLYRVAFSASSTDINSGSSRYYLCDEQSGVLRAIDCSRIGEGSYSITEVGDAKVMSLSNLPAELGALPYERVFIERGGHVYNGYQERLSNVRAAVLNWVASNALLEKLGLPTQDPEVDLALTAASYAGQWDVLMQNNSGRYTFLANGTCILPMLTTSSACQISLEKTAEPNQNILTLTSSGLDQNFPFRVKADFLAGTAREALRINDSPVDISLTRR